MKTKKRNTSENGWHQTASGCLSGVFIVFLPEKNREHQWFSGEPSSLVVEPVVDCAQKFLRPALSQVSAGPLLNAPVSIRFSEHTRETIHGWGA